MGRSVAEFAKGYLRTVLGKVGATLTLGGLVGTVLSLLDPAWGSSTGYALAVTVLGLVIVPFGPFHDMRVARDRAFVERDAVKKRLHDIEAASPRLVFCCVRGPVEMQDHRVFTKGSISIASDEILRSFQLVSVRFRNKPPVHHANAIAKDVRASIRIVDMQGQTVFDKTGRWVNPQQSLHEDNEGSLVDAVPTLDISPLHDIARLPLLMKMAWGKEIEDDTSWFVFVSSAYREVAANKIVPGEYDLTISLAGPNVQEVLFRFRVTNLEGLPHLEPFVSWTRQADF